MSEPAGVLTFVVSIINKLTMSFLKKRRLN